MQSIIDHLGTNAIHRLRIGIGGAEKGSIVSHVLGRFAPEELPALDQALERAAEAIAHAQTRGFQAAMNQFN
jgi:PTH1 family peptidyl-tRNA hydrolase